jgi:predicted dehydrogenase
VRVLFNHEYPRRVRLAAIGCGAHAYRNIFPTFAFAPVDLVAVCDLEPERARAVARQFGGAASYTDYHEMLAQEQPEAVVVVTNYDEQARPRYPRIAVDVLCAGAHVWIEKPPAGSSAQVRQMQQTSRDTGKFVQVGFKKMFFPANVKAKELLSQPEFGPVRTATARYPQHLPPLAERQDPHRMLGFLDHIVHPLSVLRFLAGPVESIYVERAPNGASVTSLRFASGAVGSLHLAHGASGMSPMERTEVVGDDANVVIDNNLRVLYYGPGAPSGEYGRAASFYESSGAPRIWEPEFSLGQLYNKGLFLLGYGPEIRYFCECVLGGQPPKVGTLDDALELLLIYEAYCSTEGERVPIGAVTTAAPAL